MANVTIRINGIGKLTSLAKKFPVATRTNIDRAIGDSLGEVARKTLPITPVKTARLRNSFIPRLRPFQGQYGTNVEYAEHVHDLYPAGRSYKNPSLNKRAVAGFLEVGVDKAQSRIQRHFKEALRRIGNDIT